MFTIPNLAAAADPKQAALDRIDLEALALSMDGRGILSGCAVSPRGSPDMTVAVAAGNALPGRVPIEIVAGIVTINTADATFPRFDLVVLTSAGAKAVREGVPGVSPIFPDPTAGDLLLAAVLVPAGATAIDATLIVDKRIGTSGPMLIEKTADQSKVNSTLANDDHLFFFMGANEVWVFEQWLALYATQGINPGFKMLHTVPAGATLHAATYGLGTTVGTGNGSATDVGGSGAPVQVTLGTGGASGSSPGNCYTRGVIVNGATAGLFRLTWAQSITNAGIPMTVKEGSWLTGQKVQ